MLIHITIGNPDRITVGIELDFPAALSVRCERRGAIGCGMIVLQIIGVIPVQQITVTVDGVLAVIIGVVGQLRDALIGGFLEKKLRIRAVKTAPNYVAVADGGIGIVQRIVSQLRDRACGGRIEENFLVTVVSYPRDVAIIVYGMQIQVLIPGREQIIGGVIRQLCRRSGG